MKENRKLIIFIYTIGVFTIINTEMGVIGILPLIAETYRVTISTAGLLVSLFALAVAISGLVMPLLFSRFNRKIIMLLVLGVFLFCNIISAFTTNFVLLVILRVAPAFLHPVYMSLAFTAASQTVSAKEAPKAVSRVLMGVSAGMVLGVPIISFIASVTSLKSAMLVFALINAVAFAATLIFVPSMPNKEKQSYGVQLNAIKKPILWISVLAVILMNGAVFGVFSYLAEYLGKVTVVSDSRISLILLLYGVANILGNWVGGRILSQRAVQLVMNFPLLLGAVYIVLFLTGQLIIPLILLVLFWGILAGASGNINQYWIASAIPEAPEFANGLFITSANLGTMAGSFICGFFITGMTVKSVFIGGLIFLALSMITIFMRVRQQIQLD